MSYVELHARSAFSFLEGASVPEELIAAALQLQMPAMALLDREDRKSTRLNSSHLVISYAVFCLKKKKPIHGVCHFGLRLATSFTTAVNLAPELSCLLNALSHTCYSVECIDAHRRSRTRHPSHLR